MCIALAAAPLSAQVYQTYGTHNAPADSPCSTPDCRYPRAPGDPADPLYPPYWQSGWTMYRVFNNYMNYPPPYAGKPPAALKAGVDYEVSYGATYYDSTWRGPTGEGAMMEHYEKRCLPIFPIANTFTCSFISLGDIAYFVTYDADRPIGMPRVCLFSPKNHPPRRDFISHLPYSKADSARLGPKAQGYSFWVDAQTGKPIQTGVNPDRTADGAIMFGYAFQSKLRTMNPQSFYFSGYPLAPANAPIVSQNYTNFRATRPDPKETWGQVAGLEPRTLPACHLFAPPQPIVAGLLQARAKDAPTWIDIGRWKKP